MTKIQLLRTRISLRGLKLIRGKKASASSLLPAKQKKEKSISTTDKKIKPVPENKASRWSLTVHAVRSSTWQAKRPPAPAPPRPAPQPASDLPDGSAASSRPRRLLLKPSLSPLPTSEFRPSHLYLCHAFSPEGRRRKLTECNCSPSSRRPATAWADPPCSSRKQRGDSRCSYAIGQSRPITGPRSRRGWGQVKPQTP